MVSVGRGAQGLPPVVRSLDLGVEGGRTVAWSVRALEQGWECGTWAGWPLGESSNWAALGGVPRGESVGKPIAWRTQGPGVAVPSPPLMGHPPSVTLQGARPQSHLGSGHCCSNSCPCRSLQSRAMGRLRAARRGGEGT